MVSKIVMSVNITYEELNSLINLINRSYGYDFSNYAKASLLRRVNKFAEDNKIESCSALETNLLDEPMAFQKFLQDMTVNVTELFRDPAYYAYLRNVVIPSLSSYPIIKIWHAGCSTGEEVFSMCILLYEAGLLGRTRLYATDINPSNLEKAKKGIIPLRYMKDYTANYMNAGGRADFSDYYTARYNNVIIQEELRKNIVFSQHNLVSDHPFNEFQFISCRNVMIYFNRQLQDRALGLFHDSLTKFGYLGIGLKETLAFSAVKDNFDTIDASLKIYRKKD